jgi:hypothetical protein
MESIGNIRYGHPKRIGKMDVAGERGSEMWRGEITEN